MIDCQATVLVFQPFPGITQVCQGLPLVAGIRFKRLARMDDPFLQAFQLDDFLGELLPLLRMRAGEDLRPERRDAFRYRSGYVSAIPWAASIRSRFLRHDGCREIGIGLVDLRIFPCQGRAVIFFILAWTWDFRPVNDSFPGSKGEIHKRNFPNKSYQAEKIFSRTLDRYRPEKICSFCNFHNQIIVNRSSAAS
ncbi:MAG: hypothetical protein ACO1N5_01580 [Noviherbaspirillum sp.]